MYLVSFIRRKLNIHKYKILEQQYWIRVQIKHALLFHMPHPDEDKNASLRLVLIFLNYEVPNLGMIFHRTLVSAGDIICVCLSR